MKKQELLGKKLKGGVWFNSIAFGILCIMVFIAMQLQTQSGSNLNKYVDTTGSNPIGIFAYIYSGTFGVLAIVATVVGGILALLGTVFFPNPYLAFAGVTSAMLPIGIGIGYDAFGIAAGLVPALFLGTVLSIFAGLAVNEVIGWYKGGVGA